MNTVSVFKISDSSLPSPHVTHPLNSAPPANYKNVSEAFLILESFYISSGLHSDAAVKTLCV
jgi:hypothetical protein